MSECRTDIAIPNAIRESLIFPRIVRILRLCVDLANSVVAGGSLVAIPCQIRAPEQGSSTGLGQNEKSMGY